jgi:hypothetical protein
VNLATGLNAQVDFRWRVLLVGISTDIYFASFADELGKRGKLMAPPSRFVFPRVEIAGFIAPTLVLGGAGFGSLLRQNGNPIQFDSTQFFDDETAIRLLETSFALTLGIDARLRLFDAFSLFATVSVQKAMAF